MIAEPRKPAGLGWITLLMCPLNVAGVFVYRRGNLSPSAFLILYSVIAAISLVALWYFWLGRNWARGLVLVTSVVALADLAFLASSGPGERALIVVEAILGAWLLYWLNTRDVRAFFVKRAQPVAD